MAISLFSKTKLRGNSIVVTADLPNLKETGLKGAPSSLSMTASNDKLLLFKQKDFDGACLFRRGRVDISDLGDKDDGGKFGFGNTITSARLTPFTVDINATFIKNKAGSLPGELTTEDEARALAAEVVAIASGLWEPFMLRMNLTSIAFQTNQTHFDLVLDRLVRFPLSFYKKNHVNLFIVNSSRVAAGITRPPCLGELIALPLIAAGGKTQSGGLGLALAHEFGHHVGIHHPGANNDPTNIMNSPLVVPVSNIQNLTEEQVSDAHTCLARNPARRGQRQG